MRKVLNIIIKKSSFALIAVVIAMSGLSIAVVTALAQPQTALADQSCPQDQFPETNIIYCGLTGSSDADYISSFQHYYDTNNDNHGHTDLQAVYNWAGASQSIVNGMNTSNMMLGTAYKDGTVVVNGRTVGTNSWISARWNIPGNNNFKQIPGNGVFIRPYWVYFFPGGVSSVPVLVYFDSNQNAVFAVTNMCGNTITFTPVPLPRSLTCDQLSESEVDTSLKYNFLVTASEENASINSYTFYFGDGTQQIIYTHDLSASTSHTYSEYNHRYTANATVQGSVPSNNGNCVVTFTTPKKPIPKPLPSVACIELTATPSTPGSLTYNFTATGQADHTSLKYFAFNFGDGSTPQQVNATATPASTSYTYKPSNPGSYNYTASVSVTDTAGQTESAPACQKPITFTLASTPTPPPNTLPNTGPGGVVGLFGAASTLGGLFHRFVLRRKFLV